MLKRLLVISIILFSLVACGGSDVVKPVLSPEEENTKKVFYNTAYDYEMAGDYLNAVEYYTKAIEIDETYEKAYYQRGRSYGLLGEDAKAVNDFTKVIKINRDAENAYVGRALGYLNLSTTININDDAKGKQSLIRAALVDLDSTLEINPDNKLALKTQNELFKRLE